MLSNADVLTLIFIPVLACGLCLLPTYFAFLREKQALAEEEGEKAARENKKEERRRKLKDAISNGLNVKEWVQDDPQTESTGGDEGDTPPSEEVVEALKPQEPPINSSPASCAMGSDDFDSVAGDEEGEMAGCAICLSSFKPQQLVCESNNPSCRHIFHKDCMVNWLMKNHDNCPMCREVYLLPVVKTV
jgi:hypothetical protein